MFPRVSYEGAGDGESPTTRVTDVRLFACVPPHVIGQCAGLGKTLSTQLTVVRPLATVLPEEKKDNVDRKDIRLGKLSCLHYVFV